MALFGNGPCQANGQNKSSKAHAFCNHWWKMVCFAALPLSIAWPLAWWFSLGCGPPCPGWHQRYPLPPAHKSTGTSWKAPHPSATTLAAHFWLYRKQNIQKIGSTSWDSAGTEQRHLLFAPHPLANLEAFSAFQLLRNKDAKELWCVGGTNLGGHAC